MSTCCFLGAGASREFGIPLTNALMPAILDRLRSGDLFGKSAMHRAMARRLLGFLRHVFPGLGRKDVAAPSIIDVLSLVDYAISTSTALRAKAAKTDLIEIRRLLEIAVCGVISDNHVPRETAKLKQFWGWIESRNTRAPDSVRIITANYDCSIEEMLRRSKNFKAICDDVDFGFDWRDPMVETPFRRPAQPWLRYYTLHGSLNWLRCDFCEHVYLNTDWEIWDVVMMRKISDANSCHCGHGKLGLLVVTPSYIRDVREPNLTEIWRHAIEALRTSDEWVIAGYSIPSDDLMIRSMFIRAYAGRAKKPQVHVVAWQNDAERDARFRLLFPNCTIERAGFGAHIGRLV